jgi:D-alanyl-D-alanine carboxypeptidase
VTLNRKSKTARGVGASFAVAALAIAIVLFPIAPAEARVKLHASTPQFTSIVIEAESGVVLSESNADSLHYPASLTKMMTLYLLFEALDKGRIRLDTQLPVSAYAAGQSPTKLGLEPGDRISVQDVILGLVTRSANDAAVIAAEWLAGNESLFAEKMTAKARALGMSRTVFHNASGLPDPDQVTTARDLAKLARALYRDFPGRYAFFATREFVFRGEVITNHNHLMDQFAGMDGIKTGYIRTSGFNLAASAVRNNERLIGVVMGGQSAHARDNQMAQLLNAGFAATNADALTAVAQASTPPQTAFAGAQDSQSFTARAKRALRNLSPVSAAEASTTTKAARANESESGRWAIQVGAFAQQSAAQKAAANALAALPSAKGKIAAVTPPNISEKDRFYRARIQNFSERDAEKACQVLHKKHRDCAVVAPNGTHLALR